MDVSGWIAMIVTLVYTSLGLPAQIRTNYLNQSTSGLSLTMTILLFCTFTSWVVYAIIASPRNWFIMASNTPGAICALILLFQFSKYRLHSK
jgi:uncharacterized protein with PQ loop repeat